MSCMKLKLNLENEGLRIPFKDYETLMLRRFWDEGGEYSSGQMYDYVNQKLREGDFERKSISRAAVIFQLNWMAEDLGILTYSDATGKGGHRRIYRAEMTESDFWTDVANEVARKLSKASGLGMAMEYD